MLAPSLKNKIRENFARDSRGLELEAKFGKYGKDGKDAFNSGLDKQTYNRVKAHFDNMVKSEVNETTDYIMGRVRKSVNKNTGVEEWITKERLWNQDIYDYNLRYSLSKEIKMSPVTAHFTAETIREKFRSSYLVFNNTVRVDITLVNSFLKNEKRTSHEVEIELLDSQALDNFEKAITVTLRLVLDTLVLYTEKERNYVTNEINGILGSGRKGSIDHYPLVQARNLKMRDLVFGGIVGNEKTGYSVTHKADGIRKMLYFAKSGVWLASTTSLTRISSVELPSLTGSILDGEFIPMEKRLKEAPKHRFWFLAFDTLAVNNDASVQNLPHLKRMEQAQTIANNVKGDVLTVNTKSFFMFDTPAEFFEKMREMFHQQPFLPYKEDGFMFTPANTIYNPHSDKLPLFKRKLTDYPDICKWKPPSELTIDLLIRRENNSLNLYSIDKSLTAFTKFDVDVENTLTQNIPNDTIVEYGFDYQKGVLIPRRIRFDKEKPNRRDVAEDVAEDIRNPIDEETMKGNTFALLRKYHNTIKKNLFTSVNNEKTLLDIGSGYGGDLGKWKNFTRIVAVEPDEEHVAELKKRLVTYNMQDKVRIVLAGGQETEKIEAEVQDWLNGKADVVSNMLSLTFFWQSSELVDRLVDTISRNLRKGGKYLLLTMDGDLVEQTFEPALGTGQVLKELKLGPATLKYNSDVFPKELYINIEGTIVENQKEWLVRLDDLKLRLEKRGIFQQVMRKADEEKFLTESEILMTKMYTYASYLRLEEREDVKDVKIPSSLPSSPSSFPSLPVLPSLPSLPPLQLGSDSDDEDDEEELGMLEMDKLEYVNVSWWDQNKEPVVRVGAIGDGSCAIHSILNGFLKIYQTNANKNFRKKFAKEVRKNIAEALALPDPRIPEKTRYETGSGGMFVEMYEQQLLGVDFQDVFKQKVDFSLQGLQKLFDSDSFLGDETYSFVAELLDIDIYVMRITNRDLYPHLNTHKPGIEKKSIVISGDGRHFETIGLLRNNLIDTFFEPNDPFILRIREFSK